jgi:hypothetical protein
VFERRVGDGVRKTNEEDDEAKDNPPFTHRGLSIYIHIHTHTHTDASALLFISLFTYPSNAAENEDAKCQ